MTRHTKPTAGDPHDQVTPVTAHGWQADLHVVAVDGDVTVTLQDSADGKTWTDLDGGAFTAFTASGAQRLIGAPTATVRRHVRACSAGEFTDAAFAVTFVRHEAPQDGTGPLFTPMIRHAPQVPPKAPAQGGRP